MAGTMQIMGNPVPVGSITIDEVNGLLVASGTGIDLTGATSSTATMQAYWDKPGQTVEIPKGTVLVAGDTPLIMQSNKTVRGQGIGATTLQLAGGIHVPIASWSLDTSVTPAILSVTLAATPFAGQFWNSSFAQLTSAMSITSSAISGGVATLGYKVYQGSVPVVGQTLYIGKMAHGVSNGGYIITAVTGTTTGTLQFSYTGSTTYGQVAEGAYGVINAAYGDPAAVVAGLNFTSGSANDGYGLPFVFEGMPKFAGFQEQDGELGVPMFPAINGQPAASCNSFKMAVSVPSGAATSGTGGFWVIAAPGIMLYDHRNNTQASNITFENMTIDGGCTPTSGKQGFSNFAIDFHPQDTYSLASNYVNATFRNVRFQNISGVSAIFIQGDRFTFEDCEFLNIASTDINGQSVSNVSIRNIRSDNTGWFNPNDPYSANPFSAAVNFDVSYQGKNVIIDNYRWTPAVGNNVLSPYAFGLVEPTAGAAFKNVLLSKCVVDVTGLQEVTSSQGTYTGEFFTGGCDNLTIADCVSIGYPLVVEANGNNLSCRNNRGMTFVLSFGAAVGVDTKYSSLDIRNNSLTIDSDYSPNPGAGFNFISCSGNPSVTGHIYDRLKIVGNDITVNWKPFATAPGGPGTPNNFAAVFATFGDGQGSANVSFLEAVAKDNTMTFVGTRGQTGSYFDRMFDIDIPQAGSTEIILSGNRTVGGGNNVKHVRAQAGCVLPILSIDGDETCNTSAIYFDESGGTMTPPVLHQVRLGTGAKFSSSVTLLDSTGALKTFRSVNGTLTPS